MPIIVGKDPRPKCFIAMPVHTRKAETETYGGDVEHWLHVMESLFIPAIEQAGYEPEIPVARGAYLIHERIVKHLSEASLVLCDLSSNNPNVFFELGVRTSLDLPIALVWDGLTSLPFDTAGINTFEYGPRLNAWDLEDQRRRLTQHIEDCAASCEGQNPLWRQFGLNLKAREPHSDANPVEAKLDLLTQEIALLTRQGDRSRLQRAAAVSLRRIVEAQERNADPDFPFRSDDEGSRKLAAAAFCQHVRRWADSGGRKVIAEESVVAPNAVEIRGLEGDRLTVEDVEELSLASRDYGVRLIAHGSPSQVWSNKELHDRGHGNAGNQPESD